MTTTPSQKHYYQGNLFHQLKGFCYTVQLGSLTKAAKFLNTSHSAISLQIKSLERDFNTQLLQRNGPRITITDTGHMLYELAFPHVGGLNELWNQFSDRINQPRELKIGVNQSAMHYILPCVLEAYYHRNPSVSVVLVYEELDSILPQLLSETLDMAIVPRRQHITIPPTCEFIQTTSFPVSLITRRDHPLAGKPHLTLAEISQYELILPAQHLRVAPMLYDKFQDLGLTKKMRTRFANSETSRKFVEMGLGINISSEVVIEPDHPLLCATSLTHIFPPVDYGCLIKREKPHAVSTLNMIAQMQQFDVSQDFKYFPKDFKQEFIPHPKYNPRCGDPFLNDVI